MLTSPAEDAGTSENSDEVEASVDWRAFVPTDVADHLATMDRAARESNCGVPWQLLAAIARVESDFGRNMATSSAGAIGYGQFLPSSWQAFGSSGNAYDYRAALPAIALYLCQSGLERDPRAALFALSSVPNSADLDTNFGQYQFVYEVEHRHAIRSLQGKTSLVGFVSRGRMGRFDDAIALAEVTGEPADIAAVRRYNTRPGINVNVEQQLSSCAAVFGRVGWANGDLEPYEFTDVDRTATVGASFAGTRWERPSDTIAIATVLNEISPIHRAFFNAGGLGILVGDGQLPHPGTERILEAFYRVPLGSWQVTADYQFVVNPGYNRDRGPVSVFAARLHKQF